MSIYSASKVFTEIFKLSSSRHRMLLRLLRKSRIFFLSLLSTWYSPMLILSSVRILAWSCKAWRRFRKPWLERLRSWNSILKEVKWIDLLRTLMRIGVNSGQDLWVGESEVNAIARFVRRQRLWIWLRIPLILCLSGGYFSPSNMKLERLKGV